MMKLLHEVENGVWDGVFVMEIERLARGTKIDQGIVVQAFQLSGTKIITPSKIYDPNNEFDEDILCNENIAISGGSICKIPYKKRTGILVCP